jgi:hypothetical protein
VLFALHVLNINSFFSGRLSMLAPFNYHESWWAGDMDHHGNTRARIKTLQNNEGNVENLVMQQQQRSGSRKVNIPPQASTFWQLDSLSWKVASACYMGCCLVMEYFHKSYLGTAVNQFPP